MLRLDIPSALVNPGRDASHAISAARYLEKCLLRAEYWGDSIAGPTEESASIRRLEFLDNAIPSVTSQKNGILRDIPHSLIHHSSI